MHGTDVNDAPYFVDGGYSTATVSELASPGTRITFLNATDLDLNQVLTFSLAPTEPFLNDGLFTFEKNEGRSEDRSCWVVRWFGSEDCEWECSRRDD